MKNMDPTTRANLVQAEVWKNIDGKTGVRRTYWMLQFFCIMAFLSSLFAVFASGNGNR